MTWLITIAVLSFSAGFWTVYRWQRRFEQRWQTRLRLHLDLIEQANRTHTQAVAQAVAEPRQQTQAEVNRLYAEVAWTGYLVIQASDRMATMIPQQPGRC